MTKYELAGDKRITLCAIVLEILIVLDFILLGDATIEYIHTLSTPFAHAFAQIQSPIASHASLKGSLIVFLVLQYGIAVIEMIARYRSDRRGFTIPLVFVPGGILLRTLIMFVIETLVIVVKLLTYFISVLLGFIFQIARLDKIMGTAHLVDGLDRTLERFEIFVNNVYNLLYFHKINPNTSVFTSIFNGSLSFWCINH